MVHVAAWQITDTTGSHNKYYRAYVAGCRVVLQYGRIGAVQSTEVKDHAHPAAAIKAATSKLEQKLNDRRKGYVTDGPTWLVNVPVAAWTDPKRHPYDLAAGYHDAEHARTTLAGSLSDGRGHVVAMVGADRFTRSTEIVAHARLHSTHPNLDVTLAVLDAKGSANADRVIHPRVALLEVGAPEDTDTTEMLAAALRLWTPGTADPQAHLAVCLENARMIFAPAQG